MVESNIAYSDIVPWLRANRCPRVYTRETVSTANEYGICRFGFGNVYEGDWKRGKLHGQGRYVHEDGDIYEGTFEDNQKHGQGKYTWCYSDEGSVYDGCWELDYRSGFGRMRSMDGRTFEGTWLKDIKCFGKETWPNGDVYVGDWQDGWVDGLRDEMRHGTGIQTWSNGTCYIQDWLNDKIHGHGMLTYPDGRVLEGNFIRGVFDNKGVSLNNE